MENKKFTKVNDKIFAKFKKSCLGDGPIAKGDFTIVPVEEVFYSGTPICPDCGEDYEFVCLMKEIE